MKPLAFKSPQALALGARSFNEVNPSVDPLLRELHSLLHQRAGHVTDICERAGISIGTVRRWFRGGGDANLASLKAVANTIGYDIKLEKLP